jgi:hypothetical protein
LFLLVLMPQTRTSWLSKTISLPWCGEWPRSGFAAPVEGGFGLPGRVLAGDDERRKCGTPDTDGPVRQAEAGRAFAVSAPAVEGRAGDAQFFADLGDAEKLVPARSRFAAKGVPELRFS